MTRPSPSCECFRVLLAMILMLIAIAHQSLRTTRMRERDSADTSEKEAV